MPSETAASSLDDAAAAIEAEEFDALEAAIEDLEAAYDAVEASESARFRRAVAARADVAPSGEPFETLNRYAKLHTSVELGRVTALSGAALFAARPAADDPEDLAGSLSELADRERTFADLAGPTDDALADVELPALVALASVEAPTEPVVKGGTVEVAATVESVGDDPAADVTLAQASDLSLSPAAADAATLAPGETLSATFSGEATVAGEVDVTLSVSSADAGERERTVTVDVLDKTEATAIAVGTLSDLRDRVEAVFDGGRERSLLAKLEAASDSVDRARGFRESGRGKQANDQLGTASRQVGAFLNELDTVGRGRGRDGLSPAVERSLRELAAAVTDQLARAQRAAV